MIAMNKKRRILQSEIERDWLCMNGGRWREGDKDCQKRHGDGWNEQEGDYRHRMKKVLKRRRYRETSGRRGHSEYTGRVVVHQRQERLSSSVEPWFASPPHIASTLSLYEYKLDSIWFVRQTLDEVTSSGVRHHSELARFCQD